MGELPAGLSTGRMKPDTVIGLPARATTFGGTSAWTMPRASVVSRAVRRTSHTDPGTRCRRKPAPAGCADAGHRRRRGERQGQSAESATVDNCSLMAYDSIPGPAAGPARLSASFARRLAHRAALTAVVVADHHQRRSTSCRAHPTRRHVIRGADQTHYGRQHWLQFLR